MVIEEVEDFDTGAVGKKKVGDVGLPAFIRHRCFKSDVGAAWLLLGLWANQARVGDDAADGGS